MQRTIRYITLLILALVVCYAASAQYFLKVTDSTDAPVEELSIYLKHLENDATHALYQTNADGMVELAAGGEYSVVIQHPAYNDFKANINIQEGVNVIKIQKLNIDLGEVVVTGQYEAVSQDKALQKVRIIDHKRIVNQGAVTLQELLGYEMNIRISRDNVLGTSAGIQGMGGQHMKIMIDGVPVIGRQDGSIDLSQINLANIERVEIIEGPMSVMYGTDALGGVINLISRKESAKKLTAEVNGLYESTGIYNFSANAMAGGDKWGNVQINAGRNFSEGMTDPNAARGDIWKPKEQLFADLTYSLPIGKVSNRIQLSAFQETLWDKGEAVSTPVSIYALDRYFYTNRYSGGIFNEFKLAKNFEVQLTNNFSVYSRVKNTYRRNLVSMEDVLVPADDAQDTSNFYLILNRAIITSKWNKPFNMQFGYDLNTEYAKGQRIEGENQSIGDYAVFASGMYNVLRFQMNVGARYAYNTRYEAPVVFNVNTRYNFNSQWSVKASYAQGFRAPSLKELNLFFVDQNHNIQGNPDLQAETSDNVSAWVTYLSKSGNLKIKTELGMFYNKLNNLITLAAVDLNTQLYSYINVNGFTSTGGTFNIEVANEKVRVLVSESFTWRAYDYDGVGSNSFFWSPELGLQMAYKPFVKTPTEFSVYFKYNGAMPGLALDADQNPVQTNIDAYSLMDASVSQPFLKNKMHFVIGVRNLLDVGNINMTGPAGGAHSGESNGMSIGMGRSIFTTLKIRI